MKKITFLAFALAGIFAFAQTPLNTNGSLEDWPDPMVSPEGWFINTNLLSNGTVAKITGGAQDGDVFVRIQAPDSSNNQAGLADIEVTAGEEYTVSFWYKTEDASRFRFWGQWRDDNNAITVSDDPFQGDYIETPASTWTNVTITSTAPAGAVVLRGSFRNYGGSSDLDIDNVILVHGGDVSVAENSIKGFTMYPNPANSMVTIQTANNDVLQVAVFDVLGKQVISQTGNTLNVSSLKSGIYMVQVTNGTSTSVQKLVVR